MSERVRKVFPRERERERKNERERDADRCFSLSLSACVSLSLTIELVGGARERDRRRTMITFRSTTMIFYYCALSLTFLLLPSSLGLKGGWWVVPVEARSLPSHESDDGNRKQMEIAGAMDGKSKERLDRYKSYWLWKKKRSEKGTSSSPSSSSSSDKNADDDVSRSRRMMLQRKRENNPDFKELEMQRKARDQNRMEGIRKWRERRQLRRRQGNVTEHTPPRLSPRKVEMRQRNIPEAPPLLAQKAREEALARKRQVVAREARGGRKARPKTTRERFSEWERRYSMAERAWARESKMLHSMFGDTYQGNLGVNSNTNSEKPVMFVHISNSGGTAACNSVSGGGVRVTLEGNCNLMCNMPWLWSRYYKGPGEWTRSEMMTLNSCNRNEEHVQNMMVDERDCEAMAKYAEKWKFRILFREMVLAETGEEANDFTICPQFRYVMFFKDPIKRYESELSIRHGFDGANATKRFVEKSYAGEDNGERAWFGPSLLNMREGLGHIMPGTPGINNFVTRTLLGPDVFTLPPKKITEEHLDRARAILSKFEAVIPLEKAFESYTWRIFASLFPEVGERLFYRTKAQLWCKHANVKKNTHKDYIKGDERLHKMIKEMNTIDTALHNEMTAKYVKQMEMFYQQYPDENKMRMERLPSCAEARRHYYARRRAVERKNT